jgi:hypothetical protein
VKDKNGVHVLEMYDVLHHQSIRESGFCHWRSQTRRGGDGARLRAEEAFLGVLDERVVLL